VGVGVGVGEIEACPWEGATREGSVQAEEASFEVERGRRRVAPRATLQQEAAEEESRGDVLRIGAGDGAGGVHRAALGEEGGEEAVARGYLASRFVTLPGDL